MKAFDDMYEACEDFGDVVELARSGYRTIQNVLNTLERVKDAKDPAYILAQIHKALEPYIDGET